MDLIFPPFVAAALAEWGDKTQLLALALGLRFARPVPVIAGIALAALANSLIGAFGGSLIHPMISYDATLLFLGLGFAFAAIGALLPFRERDHGASWRLGAFGTSFAAFFILELGDKTQFITAGFAAVHGAWLPVALAATAGILVGAVPAVMMGERLRALPLKAIRRVVAGVFGFTAIILAINALRLI